MTTRQWGGSLPANHTTAIFAGALQNGRKLHHKEAQTQYETERAHNVAEQLVV